MKSIVFIKVLPVLHFLFTLFRPKHYCSTEKLNCEDLTGCLTIWKLYLIELSNCHMKTWKFYINVNLLYSSSYAENRLYLDVYSSIKMPYANIATNKTWCCTHCVNIISCNNDGTIHPNSYIIVFRFGDFTKQIYVRILHW